MNHDIDRTQVGFGSELGSSAPYPGGGVFHPDTHANLAADLLDVKSEQELNYFLGDVISSATSAIGDFINSPTGQALGSGLKDVAKTALPLVGTALGGRLAVRRAHKSAEPWGRRWRVVLKWLPRSRSGRRRTPSSSWPARLPRMLLKRRRGRIRTPLPSTQSSKRRRSTLPVWYPR